MKLAVSGLVIGTFPIEGADRIRLAYKERT